MITGGRWAGSSREDELLSRLYQQVTEQQTARFGSGYDVTAGAARYQAWLRENSAGDQAGREAIRAGTAMALRASAAGVTAVTAAPGLGQAVLSGPATWRPAGTRSETPGAAASWTPTAR